MKTNINYKSLRYHLVISSCASSFKAYDIIFHLKFISNDTRKVLKYCVLMFVPSFIPVCFHIWEIFNTPFSHMPYCVSHKRLHNTFCVNHLIVIYVILRELSYYQAPWWYVDEDIEFYCNSVHIYLTVAGRF